MREQIRKKIKNDDLYEGCREAFKNGWQRVKLYFLCGLPGERVGRSRRHRRHGRARSPHIGKEVTGRYVEVTASVSNFVPKPHTPYQWNGMQTREYLRWAGAVPAQALPAAGGEDQAARHRVQPARRHPDARRPARGRRRWRKPGGAAAGSTAGASASSRDIWWQTFADLGIDAAWYSQRNRPMTEVLPWDHVNVKKGREYLEKEQNRSLVQLQVMAEAT